MISSARITLIACCLSLGCAGAPARSCSNCADRPEAKTSALAASTPLYLFWVQEQLPEGLGSARPADLPSPAGSAVLVAPGWLLSSIESMGAVADDALMDPTVHLFDGAAWHKGEFKDRDKGSGLALIRADGIPGRPMVLQPDTAESDLRPPEQAVAATVALPWILSRQTPIARLVRKAFELPREKCSNAPFYLPLSERLQDAPVLCLEGRVSDLPGGAFVDSAGRLAGVQVNRTGARVQAGPDAAGIRRFVGTYFSSWGRDVKPKPQL